MATRRNRIVVKPNLKPAGPKPGNAAKPKSSTIQAAVESATLSVKSKSHQAPADTSVVTSTDGEEKNDTPLLNESKQGEVSFVENNMNDVRQKLNSLLKKTPEAQQESSKAAKHSQEKDVILIDSTLGDKCVISNSAEPIEPLGQKKSGLSIDQGNIDAGVLEEVDKAAEKGDIQDKTAKDLAVTEMSSGLVPVDKTPIPDVSAKGKPGDDCSLRESVQGVRDERDSVAGEDRDVPDAVSEIRDMMEEEMAQTKTQRKKREKKERKEPLPRSDQSPDRHKMKMSDLIVWNPSQNYLPSKKKKSAAQVKKEERPISPDSTVSLDDESSNQSSSLPAPQVMIGPDGNIVLNTQSLIIETPKDASAEGKVIIEEDDDDRYLNSNTYRKTSKPKMWTERENEKFFMGLSMCGTDFSLMCNLLTKRTRRELKNKFRREERRNRSLIDKALASRQPYDVAPFEKMAAEDLAKIKQAKEEKLEMKRKMRQEAGDEQKKKKVKKERGRSRKRKAEDLDEEEENWEEPVYDDEGDENQPEEDDEDTNDSIVITANNTVSKRNARKEKFNTKGNPGTSTHSNLPAFGALTSNGDQNLIPNAVSAPSTSSYDESTTIINGTENDNSIILLSADGEETSRSEQATPQSLTVTSSGHIVQRQEMRADVPQPQGSAQESDISRRLTTGLRSIPGSAPIQIEMEGVTCPMQGVLIPSHMVPHLAPQLGIPQTNAPMQVLLVQEEGSAGNMVHVYVIPEKDSGAPTVFAQTGHGRVASNETGLTLTSPVPSPHPVQRRLSTCSTPTPSPAPVSPAPFSPPPVPVHQQAALASPPPSSHQLERETTLSTVRSVYGTAMNSLSPSHTATTTIPATTGEESSALQVNSATTTTGYSLPGSLHHHHHQQFSKGKGQVHHPIPVPKSNQLTVIRNPHTVPKPPMYSINATTANTILPSTITAPQKGISQNASLSTDYIEHQGSNPVSNPSLHEHTGQIVTSPQCQSTSAPFAQPQCTGDILVTPTTHPNSPHTLTDAFQAPLTSSSSLSSISQTVSISNSADIS